MAINQITRLSIIIPVLNEAATLTATLLALQPLRMAGHEVIVVDGGSHDTSLFLAEAGADQVVRAERGRARQMNAGAASARHEVLLFLHADTQLPPHADQLIIEGLQKSAHHPSHQWGRFDVQLSGKYFLLRVIEHSMNWRSRITGIATGDQAIFICRDLFQHVGGFPDIPLMEDITLSCTLKRHGSPLCLQQRVITSSRRWEQRGIVRTLLLMWWLRLAYALGTNPQRLAQLYEHAKP